MSTLAATNLKHASSASNNIVLDSSGNATFAGTAVPASSFLRNRIINGDMRIDQRNAGASVTPNNTYTLDRWQGQNSQTSKYTVQQSSVAPTGFNNSLLVTSSSAYSVSSGDYFFINQPIEGFNTSDLSFGTADASTISISFWVRSSLTGTFGGSIRNYAVNRSYAFNYTISAANTWERKTITIVGDTSGTWIGSTNSVGMYVVWCFGAGSTFLTTANTWTAGNIIGPTGQTSVVGTNGATFYLTGVQLEVGSAATPFERRQFGQELMLCQRYFQKTFDQSVAPAQNAGGSGGLTAPGSVTNVSINASWWFACPMRAVPTVVTFAPDQASANWSDQGGTRPTAAVTSTGEASVGIRGQISVLAGGYYIIQATASAEL